jgi:hypothetical protein
MVWPIVDLPKVQQALSELKGAEDEKKFILVWIILLAPNVGNGLVVVSCNVS